MTRSKVVILLISFLGLFHCAIAQQPSLEKYIVITFDDTYKISEHGTKSYYWIIPQDSIKSNDNNLSYLFLSDFSKTDLIDCCNGKDVDPLTVFQNRNHELFDSTYYKMLDDLEKIIISRRTKLQTITKKWETGQKEVITIFETPISGKFCSSNFDFFRQKRYSYKGKVYLPYSSFTYDEEFWGSAKAKLCLHEDFSKIKFDIIWY